MARDARGLPRPGEDTQRRALLRAEQGFQLSRLILGQGAGQLPRDVPLGQHRRARDQLLDHERPGGECAGGAVRP